MPWNETCAMTERMKFVALVEEGDETIAALCRRFGISRKTGYKLLARYAAEGMDGLCDRSHAARHHPNAVSEIIESRIVALRSEHPSWGPRKLRARLRMIEPEMHWPTASTMGDILRRHGLVVPRRRRLTTPADTSPFADCAGANDSWCVDYKGWFRTGDVRGLCSRQHSANTDCRVRSAATMGRHLRALVQAACRSFPYGGSNSASGRSGSHQDSPRRTVVTSACTAHWRSTLASRRQRTDVRSSNASMLSVASTMRSGLMRESVISLPARSIGPPRERIRRVCPTSPTPITGKSAWCVRPEKSSGAASDCSSTKCWPGNQLVSKNMTAAPGPCTSVPSCSVPSIMPVNSKDRLSHGVGAARCARQLLRAPRLRADDVLPIERSKVLPIVPAAQFASLTGRGSRPRARHECGPARFVHSTSSFQTAFFVPAARFCARVLLFSLRAPG